LTLILRGDRWSLDRGDSRHGGGYPGGMPEGRGQWPIRRYRLGEEPPDDLSETTTPAERLAMMWPMAHEGWLLSGRPLPTYDRASTPSRIFRGGEHPDDE
jgi:hypothetical protein